MGKCSGCKHFDYDELWDGEEEIELFCCSKGHYEHIGWNTEPCEDYEAPNWCEMKEVEKK